MSHLILFDESCPFCQRCVLFLLKRDKKKKFKFSDLNGVAAQQLGSSIKLGTIDSIIYVENYTLENQQVFYRSKAVFKILYTLGGFYKLIGWKYVLPSFLFDWAYVLVAKNRKKLCPKKVPYKRESYKEHFLP